MRSSSRRSLPILALGVVCLQAQTPDPRTGEFFESRIRPLLAQHCYACHSQRAATVFGELLLDSAEGLSAGGRSGPAVMAGDPDASRLIQAVRHAEGVVAMPPAGRLTDRQVEDLAAWVRQGASWPDKATVEALASKESDGASAQHWAWTELRDPSQPEVRDGEWPRGPIDRFVLGRLEQRWLAPVGGADRATLLRRIALDLTGLPPSASDVEDIASDPLPDALERVVDRYLASPAFGERWARHWLDLASYADTLGLGRRITSKHAWRYRDYVIDSFNSDKPYDRFVREQVAGDVLSYDDDDQRREHVVATGFLAIGPWALVDQDKEQLRMDIVDHQIDTIGRALLGVTTGCARCHDHKFDPVPQSDYYALAGIFRSTRTLDGRMSGVFSDVMRVPLAETAGELLERSSALVEWEREYESALEEQRAAEGVVSKLAAEVEALEGEPGEELAKRLADARAAARTSATEAQRILYYGKPTPPMALALADDPDPADARICLAGNPHSLGEEVRRGFLSLVPLDPSPKIANRRLFGIGYQKSSGRLELADWLADSRNPLPARVMANRVWHHLFGRGIVASADNFGILGDRPSHPELLDYLAVRLQRQEWSLKALIREIVLSATYRLSASHSGEAAAADPENTLFWRANRRRLEAEAIRDAVLFVSDSMDFRAGGPTLPLGSRGSVQMGQPPLLAGSLELTSSIRNRRTVYLPVLRKSQLSDVDVLNLFDFPDPNAVKGRRDVTTVPTQALYLMNSPFLVRQARAAARRLLAEPGLDDGGRVNTFLRKALSRPATGQEIAQALAFLRDTETELGRDEAWARYCHAVFASSEFLFRG